MKSGSSRNKGTVQKAALEDLSNPKMLEEVSSSVSLFFFLPYLIF